MRYLIALATVLSIAGCQTTRTMYYNAWESMGYAKRERLVDYVEAARDEQGQAKEQFASALEQFKSVVGFQGGDLEKMYNDLNRSYERSAAQAQEEGERKLDARGRCGRGLRAGSRFRNCVLPG